MLFRARGGAGFLLGLVLFSGFLCGVSGSQIVRFHDNWKFYNGNASGAEAVFFDDASWATVHLPHPMTLASPGGSCPTGYCWYRKTFSATAYQGKKAVIEFQGAMQTADVYVNGTLVTTHLGGYDPFAIDITDNLSFTGPNVLAVRLNNASSTGFPPGKSVPDFRYWGGLYRDVYLYLSDSLHISHPLAADVPAGGGVFVTYPAVSASSATVEVKTHVVNQRRGAQSCVGSTAKPMLFGEYGDWDFGGGRDRCGRNSESGMTVLARNHYWSLNANRALSALQADAVWTAIDYQSGGITRSGAIDWARLPKFSAYFYQSQRDPSVTIAGVNSGPMVYIMNWWTQSSPTRIRVFSNCDQVRLSLNGVVVATNSPDASDPDSSAYLEHRPFTFTTSFSSGTLLAEGLIGETVKAKHSVTTPGNASKVAVLIDTAYLPPLEADGSDLAFVYASIVDDNGTLLKTATNNVTFTITGPATLVTTETGASVTVKAEAGVATALLRAGTTPGQVIVNAASGNLIKGGDTVVVGTAGTQGIIPAPAATAAPHVPFSIHRTGGTLRVEVPSMKTNGAKFTLISAQGRAAGRWNLTINITLVNLTSLPHGVYFGEITSGSDRFVRKVLW